MSKKIKLDTTILKTELEGVWRVMIPQGDKTNEGFFEDLDEYELVLIQDRDDPDRFMGFYEGDSITGELDLHWIPSVDSELITLYYTFSEGDDFETMIGGGIVSQTEPDSLMGIKLIHMGEKQKFYWKRISKEVPKDILARFECEDEEESELLHDFLDDFNHVRKPKSLEALLLCKAGLLKILKLGGICTLEQLLEAKEEELLAIQGIGHSRIYELHSLLVHTGHITEPTYEPDPSKLDKVFRFSLASEGKLKATHIIEVLGCHTMEDLHNIILEAYDYDIYDRDHLYSFYMSGVFHDLNSAIAHELADLKHDAAKMVIANLHMTAGKKIAYWFDFGSFFRLIIQLVSISEEAIPKSEQHRYPCIEETARI
jgi:hypothetical protein